MRHVLKTVIALLITLSCLLPATLYADTTTPIVVKLTLHDTIQPITADYLQRGLQEAARQHAQLVLVSMGTPGGLLESTRVMVQAIENSPVPVVIFISPSGSRAASAGFFILEAADIAAMAPGTNAGAAHPMVVGNQIDPVLKQKIENDAAAFLRSYTGRRGRNVQAAEDAIRNSKSYSDEEALNLKLIDLVTLDDASLLTALDNREIHRFDGSTQTLHLKGAAIVTTAPSLRERLLSKLTNPDIAVLLMVLGGLLIYLEFNVPGTVVPGSLGTLFVLLSLFGLNLLPVRHTAIALLLAAAITFGLAWIALRARRSKVLTGPQAMIGRTAIARTPLNPTGQVEIRGELWQASLRGAASLAIGSAVYVRGIEGLVLIVEPAQDTV